MLTLNNVDKKDKNFMYQNLQKSKCFKCSFDRSSFDYVNFRGAHLKSCSFNNGSFIGTELVGTNIKDSSFRNAVFQDAVFEGAKLDGVDFKGASLSGTYFVGCSFNEVKGLNFGSLDIKVLNEMPKLELSESLLEAFELLMKNAFVAKARVLDTKEKTLNTISVLRLLDLFTEAEIVENAAALSASLDREFFTLSYLMRALQKLVKTNGGEN